jgi:hypothetical protein
MSNKPFVYLYMGFVSHMNYDMPILSLLFLGRSSSRRRQPRERLQRRRQPESGRLQRQPRERLQRRRQPESGRLQSKKQGRCDVCMRYA